LSAYIAAFFLQKPNTFAFNFAAQSANVYLMYFQNNLEISLFLLPYVRTV